MLPLPWRDEHLLLALGLLATGAHAQSSSPPAKTNCSPQYCLLYTLGAYFVKKGLRLDYSQKQRKHLAVQDAALAALATAVERFTSLPAALSYLDSQGWEPM